MTAAAPVRSSRGRRIAISAGSLAVLLGALDTYVVVTIMTDIMKDVGIAINQIQRVTPIVTGYLLGYIAAMPLLGRASDRFGRKMLLQVSLAGFAIGSIITALSTDLTMLVIGRVVQGAASGALLPVTLALAADLWAARNRAGVLGGIGAAQELGSVLGPMYGIALVWVFHHWQSRVLGQRPAGADRDGDDPLQPAVEAEDRPSGKGRRRRRRAAGDRARTCRRRHCTTPRRTANRCCPSYGLPLLIGALVAAVAFFVWERFAKTRLIEPAGVHFRPFLAALGASLTAGAALMVTLVNVELFGQGVLGQDQNEAAFLLLRFLIALPIGALLGGWIATRVGDRAVACVGLLIAAGGYYLIAQWPVDLLAARHDLGFVQPAGARYRPGDRRARARPGDRAADVGDPARGALRAARHRLRGGGGGPDDRHAGRHRGAQRLGSLPVQSAPHGAASCTTATERRDSARARRRCSDAV